MIFSEILPPASRSDNVPCKALLENVEGDAVITRVRQWEHRKYF